MSLYYETAPYLSPGSPSTSLKSRVFNSKKEQSKSTPKQIYALATEAASWSPVLSEIIESSQLLELERKLSPELALLLTHDLLLTKRGISAPASHVLRQAVERHRARLNADFVRARLRRRCSTIDQLRDALKKKAEQATNVLEPSDNDRLAVEVSFHPRWVRLNSCKTSMKEQLETTFKGYDQVHNLQDLRSSATKSLHLDKHVPNLIALPPNADITKSSAYTTGLLILQDKASCFPAYLLDASPEEGDIMDACAAPGNKTTHLSAILQEKSLSQDATKKTSIIHACERDTSRAAVLHQMTALASSCSHQIIKIHAGQDFLHINPHNAPWNTITSLLLDPSCSGSGIIGRDDYDFALKVTLPRRADAAPPTSSNKSKKRKRDITSTPATPIIPSPKPVPPSPMAKELTSRLASLQAFQLRLLLHAFTFPGARRISYSTCSIHAEENEHVVIKALTSEVAKTSGWRVLRREEQVEGMRRWEVRGVWSAAREIVQVLDGHAGGRNGLEAKVEEIVGACIRCEKGTREGTQGFFVAAFVRHASPGEGEISARDQQALRNEDGGGRRSRVTADDPAEDEDEEWDGFQD